MNEPVALVPYWSYLVPLGIAAIVAIQAVLVAYFGTKIENAATATADSAEKIHIAVNSERKEMVDKIEALHAVILEMTRASKT